MKAAVISSYRGPETLNEVDVSEPEAGPGQIAVRQIFAGVNYTDDVAYDSVERDTIERSLRCLKLRGTCVSFGASSGAVDSIVPMELAECGSVFFTRPHLAHYRRTAKESQQRMDDLVVLLRSGSLKQTIDRIFPLGAAAEADLWLESRASQGKILLKTRGQRDEII